MIVDLDNRGLPPPEPMMHILEALDTLARGDEVRALLDREPLFLYPELDDRALAYDCSRNDDGSYTLRVRHR